MNFSKATDVLDVIRAGDESNRIRGENRVRINQAANGFPPLTEDEAKKMRLPVNVNFLELAVLLANARRQYTKAFNGTANFFRISLPDAPSEKALDWGVFITSFINKVLKRSQPYFWVRQNKWASVVAHGLGPTCWWDQESWCPKYVAIEDLRVATDTQISFENLDWYAIRVPSTEGELTQKVFGEHAAKGWNKKAIAKILHAYRNNNYADASSNYNWLESPEKLAELIKQSLGVYSSDAQPVINLWHFWFRERSKNGWMFRVVPDWTVGAEVPTNEFLYTDDQPAATELSRLLHVQFGDLSTKSPFLFHSVRSLGFLLLEPAYFSSLVRCRMLAHTMENLNAWFRCTDPAGRARAQKVEMFHTAFLPEGVSIVPNSDRHQVDHELVEFVMAQMKQLMSEASAAYTQDTDTGTAKERTAFEVSTQVAAVNALMDGLLTTASFQERASYEEICRRFCLRNSSDSDAQEFQAACTKRGIPKLWVNSELWDVQVEMPMGAGNPAMAMAEAKQLLEMRPMFSGSAQQEILHEATSVITSDPRKAQRWVPLDDTFHVSDAMRDAEFAFGTLMQGVPVRMKEGLSAMEQIETLLGLLAGVISRIEQQDNLGTAGEVLGLSTVGNYINQLIQQVAQDQSEKARVKEYSDTLGKLMNSVKGFQQRLQEEQTKPAQPDPEQIAKAQATTMQAQTKMAISERSAQQKQAHKDVALQKEQQRRDAQTAAEIQRENLKTGAELGRENVKTGAEMHREGAKAGSEIAREHVKTKADIANTKKMAAAKPKQDKKV